MTASTSRDPSTLFAQPAAFAVITVAVWVFLVVGVVWILSGVVRLVVGVVRDEYGPRAACRAERARRARRDRSATSGLVANVRPADADLPFYNWATDAEEHAL